MVANEVDGTFPSLHIAIVDRYAAACGVDVDRNLRVSATDHGQAHGHRFYDGGQTDGIFRLLAADRHTLGACHDKAQFVRNKPLHKFKPDVAPHGQLSKDVLIAHVARHPRHIDVEVSSRGVESVDERGHVAHLLARRHEAVVCAVGGSDHAVIEVEVGTPMSQHHACGVGLGCEQRVVDKLL